MRLTLDSLLVLDAIDRGGSFAAAAEQLHRVPSAVSYTIHKLEQDLGVALFDRSGHRARLTRAGELLLKEGRPLLREAEELELRVRQGAGAGARVAIAVGELVRRAALYPLLHAFYEAPGHQSTYLSVTRECQTTGWDALLGGRADIMIGALEPGPLANGYRTRALGEVEMALVVPATHPLARVEEPLTRALCAQYRIVRPAVQPFGPRTEDPAPRTMTVDDYGAQVEAIRHGLGIGYVAAYSVQEDVDAGRLVAKSVADAPRLRLATAWRSSSVGLAVEWFLERLCDQELCARLVPRTA